MKNLMQSGDESSILRYLIDNHLTTRTLPVVPSEYNKEQRSVRMVFATENPVSVPDYERWEMVDEILLMDGMEIPANGQVPMLDCHNRSSLDYQLGSCRDIKVVGSQAECVGYFDSTEDGMKAETKVSEGHVTDSSVGYRAIESTYIPAGQSSLIKGRSFQGPVRITSRWTLREVSLTPIGADMMAKMRSDNFLDGMRKALETRGLPANATPAEIVDFVTHLPADNGVGGSKPQSQSQGARIMADEQRKPTPEDQARMDQERVREIEAIGREFEGRIPGGANAMRQLEKDAVNLKVPVEVFRGTVYDSVTDTKALHKTAADLDLTEKQKREYSFSRLMAHVITEGRVEAGFERECSAEIAKKAGRQLEARRFIIPNDARIAVDPFRLESKRDLTVGSLTGGGYLVGTQHMPAEFADILRNELILPKLGVRVLPGLVQNVSIPRRTGGASFAFVTENASGTESSNVFGTVNMTPKTGTTYVDISRQLALQGTPAAEQLVNEDLVWTCTEGFEDAFFTGSGSSGEPYGIANTTSVGSVNGGAIDWNKLVEFETDVATAKAPGLKAFVCNAATRGLLKTRRIVDGYPDFLIDRLTGQANGYPVIVSEVIPNNYLFFGAWQHALLGLWGGIEVLINPFEGAAAGTIRVHVYASMDVGVKQPTAFTLADDVS